MAEERAPFFVFISSAQKEFKNLREDLRQTIDTEMLSNQRVMKAILVEEERGTSISEDVRRGLEKSSIYLGIFGKVLSEWVKREYHEARVRGLPLLVYHYKKPRRRGRPRRQRAGGRKSKVQAFLDDEVKRDDVRIRGPYYSEEALIDHVMYDLASQVANMVNEAAAIRKTLHKGLAVP